MRSLLVAYGNFLFRYRNSLFFVVLVALFAVFRPVAPRGSARLDEWLDLAGIAVSAFGQALRAAVIGFAYIKRGGVNKRIHADRLVTEGFFAHARNPLYDGNLLILLGLFIIYNNPWVYAIGIPFFVTAYVAIVAAEEDFLRRKFGAAYEEYCRSVGRWLPRLRGLRATMRGMEFNWRRVIIKDYGSGYTWMAAALILMAYARCINPGLPGALPTLTGLGLALLVLTGAFLTARYLKKSRILTENPR